MIRSILKTGFSILAVTLLISGCSSKQEVDMSDKKSEATYVDPELQGAPTWVMIPEVKGFVAEVGSAPRNAGNDFSFQREEAIANARDNIARQLSVKVENMFKSYKAATGSKEDATFDRSAERVSKQIANQTLSGTVVKDTWISKSGTLYVLMVIDTNSVANTMEEATKTSFKNDKALYQKFLASKAQGELAKEIERLEE